MSFRAERVRIFNHRPVIVTRPPPRRSLEIRDDDRQLRVRHHVTLSGLIRMRLFATLLSLSVLVTIPAHAQRPQHYLVQSPDGATTLAVDVDGRVTYSVTHRGRALLDASPISLSLGGGRVLGRGETVRTNTSRSVRDSMRPVAPTKRAVVPDRFNELRLRFSGYDLEFRAYDEGVSYRWVVALPDTITIVAEEASFAVAGQAEGVLGIDTTFMTHYEPAFHRAPLDTLKDGRRALLPTLIALQRGLGVALRRG